MPNAHGAASLSAETLKSYSLLRETCGVLRVSRLSLMEMRGEDRKAWLQGQCTNDLRRFEPGTSISFCICTPTGQLLAPCTAWAFRDRFVIALPTACREAFQERTDTMIIMEDVQVRDLTEEYAWHSVQGPSATAELSRSFSLPTLDAGEIDGTLLLRANRTGYGGWDVLVPRGPNTPSSTAPHTEVCATSSDSHTEVRDTFQTGIEDVNEEALFIARLEAGIPWFDIDMNEKTLPPEMGPDFESKFISYSKGCYTGQEVLMRIHSRGHTNRTWMALMLDGPAQPGDVITHASREDAGVITSAAESSRFGFIAGAMLRNEAAAEGETILVRRGCGEVEGEVVRMPLLRFA